MIEIEVDVADLAKVRFTTDAVWETTASIHAFVFLRHHLLHQRLRRLVPKRPDFDLDHLLTLARNPAWLPDVWAPAPSARPGDPLAQLDALRHTEPAVAEADLEQLRILAPDSAAARMQPREYLDAPPTALQGWWAAVLEPLWDRVDAIQRADIAHHQSVLATARARRDHAGAAPGLSFQDGQLRVDLGEGLVSPEVVRAGHLVHAVGVPLAVGRRSTPARRSPPSSRTARAGPGGCGSARAGRRPRGCPTSSAAPGP